MNVLFQREQPFDQCGQLFVDSSQWKASPMNKRYYMIYPNHIAPLRQALVTINVHTIDCFYWAHHVQTIGHGETWFFIGKCTSGLLFIYHKHKDDHHHVSVEMKLAESEDLLYHIGLTQSQRDWLTP